MRISTQITSILDSKNKFPNCDMYIKKIKTPSTIFFKCLDENFKLYFSYGNKLKFNFLEESAFEDLYFNANSIVQYGWKKEAVPIVQEKKSLIARFFNIFSQ